MLFTIKKSTFSLNVIVSILIALIAFVFSLAIDPYYTGGDPSLYRKVHEELARLNLFDGYIFYSITLDSTEFVHFFLAWVASNIHIDRDIFNSIFSAVLAYISMRICIKRNASLFVAAFIVFTSFYFILLYTTTERLKISVIFFLLSMLSINKPKRFYIFAILASISHIQIMVLYFSILFYRVAKEFYSALFRGTITKTLLFLIPLILIPLTLVQSQIYSKLNSYFGLGNISDLLRVFPFLILSLWYSKNKTEIFSIFFPLAIAVIILGYGRLNIFAYFIFLYYALPVKRGLNVGILLTSVYFMYSSIAFISRIIEFGEPLLAP